MKSTIILSAILSLCQFGDCVLLFSGSTVIMLVFQTSYSEISCEFFFFFFTPPTDPKPGNSFDAKRIKRGWPKPYGFFLGFINTLLRRISVILSFALFFCCCFFCFGFLFCLFVCLFFCRWNEPKLKLFRPSIFPWEILEGAYKKKKGGDLLTARAMGWS